MMPRGVLNCFVDLRLHAVNAPGVWLPSIEDVYISVSLFDQCQNTRLLTSIFPLLIHEKLHFEKRFPSAVDPSDVTDSLEDETLSIELVQLSQYTDDGIRMASYVCNARCFLFPIHCAAATPSTVREIELIFCKNVNFSGIPPRLEFSVKTVIKEFRCPEEEAEEDEIQCRRSRRKSRQPPCRRRVRACSYIDKGEEDDPSEKMDHQPPFYSREIDQEFIEHVPGARPYSNIICKRARDDIDRHKKSRRRIRLEKMICELLRDPAFKSSKNSLSDDDAGVTEVARSCFSPCSYSRLYTLPSACPSPCPRTRSCVPCPLPRPRPRVCARSLSPTPRPLVCSPLRSYTPSYCSKLADRVTRLEDEQLARMAADRAHREQSVCMASGRLSSLCPYYPSSSTFDTQYGSKYSGQRTKRCPLFY